MEESILNTIKTMLGVSHTDDSFDQEIIVGINSSLMVVQQLGLGPDNVFSITGSEQTWEQLLQTNMALYQAVKTYIYLKTRLVFDPPGTSFLLSAYEKQILELEWRLAAQVPIPPEPVIPEEEV